MTEETLFSALLNNLGLLAIVVLAFGAVLRNTAPGSTRDAVIGLLFGTAAILSIMQPVVVRPGVILDGRAIFLVLAALFARWPGVALAAILAAAYRYHSGGVGTFGGIVGIFLAAGAGLVHAGWFNGRPHRFTMRSLAILGFLASSMLAGIFLLPDAMAWPVFRLVAIPVMLGNFAGTVLFGVLLAREKQRHESTMRFKRDARTDALTGLGNRRTFDFDSGSAFEKARRGSSVLSLAVIDIDYFKRINDIWGHAAGDAVLKQVGDVISETARRNDAVSRIGGEEITVLMPKTGAPQCTAVADRIRRAIESTVFDLSGIHIKVTVSIGTATLDPSMGRFSDLFDAADKALYAAKTNGRNRVEAAGEAKAA